MRRDAGSGRGAQQHPSGRSGVHAIERMRGAAQAAGMHYRFVAQSLDSNAERIERVVRCPDVAPRIEIRDSQWRVASSTDDECPMGYGLVPGNADAAAQTAWAKGYQQESLIVS
jgi:hypothetical protein